MTCCFTESQVLQLLDGAADAARAAVGRGASRRLRRLPRAGRGDGGGIMPAGERTPNDGDAGGATAGGRASCRGARAATSCAGLVGPAAWAWSTPPYDPRARPPVALKLLRTSPARGDEPARRAPAARGAGDGAAAASERGRGPRRRHARRAASSSRWSSSTARRCARGCGRAARRSARSVRACSLQRGPRARRRARARARAPRLQAGQRARRHATAACASPTSGWRAPRRAEAGEAAATADAGARSTRR